MEINVYLTDKCNPNAAVKIMDRIKELGLTDLKYRTEPDRILATYKGKNEGLRNFAETINNEFGDAIDSMTRL